MAKYESNISDPLGNLEWVDTAATTSTSIIKLLGSDYGVGANDKLLCVDIDNTNNVTDDIFLRMWMHSGSPTAAVSACDIILKCASGARQVYSWPIGIPMDANGTSSIKIHYAVTNVNTAVSAGTALTANPTVRMLFSLG